MNRRNHKRTRKDHYTEKKQSKTNQAASAKKHLSKGMIITQTIMNSN